MKKGGIITQETRILKLRSSMAAQGIDAALIFSPENRYYFSNFRGTAGALLITHNYTLLFTDFRYSEQAKEQAPLFEVVQHQQNMLALISQSLDKFSIKHLGLEIDKMTAAEYLKVMQMSPTVKVSSIDNLTAEIRQTKDQTEIAQIQKGLEICDKAFKHILNFIRPGITEKDIGLELQVFMLRAGAEGIKANHVIASGERSALPHGQATERVIRQGDFITMDYGARVNGYYSDFTRTVILGEPNDQQQEIYDIVFKAQEAALATIGPGKICAEMDEVARAIIRQAGYGDNFGHSLGHSLGLEIHEKPTMRSTDSSTLKPGTVISVEPGIYLPGFGGVRIEDLVEITENSLINLTQSTKALQILNT
ncbi:MAG: M24 family metallopeptidase [Desulfitobacteriaceae bacterium]